MEGKHLELREWDKFEVISMPQAEFKREEEASKMIGMKLNFSLCLTSIE